MVNAYIVPVPPMEVQEEIVRILDTFQTHAAELQAELQARKEQYEYYRNLLLTFSPCAAGSGADGEQKENNVNTPPQGVMKLSGKLWAKSARFSEVLQAKPKTILQMAMHVSFLI